MSLGMLAIRSRGGPTPEMPIALPAAAPILGHPEQCPAQGAALQLHRQFEIPVDEDRPPAGLVAIDDRRTAWLSSVSGRVHLADNTGTTNLSTSWEHGFQAIASGPDGLLASTGTELWSIEIADRLSPSRLASFPTSEIISFAYASQRIAVSLFDNGYELNLYDSGTLELATSISLPRATGVSALEDSFLTWEVLPPFQVRLLDMRGDPLATLVSPMSVNKIRRAAKSLYSLAALPLDCGRVLQVLSDLRSQDRWFVVHEIASGDPRIIRATRLEIPIGFTQRIKGRQVLVGASAGPGGALVVGYQYNFLMNEG